MTITAKAVAVIGLLLLFVGFVGSTSKVASESESESEIVIGTLSFYAYCFNTEI